MLITSCMFWFVLNLLFFANIRSSHIHTFFSLKTAPVYTVDLFLDTKANDSAKFRAVFANRISYTRTVHDEIKVWVANNIEDWRRTKPNWFNIEAIPDEYLPASVVAAEGGAKRRRSSVSVRSRLRL